MAKQKSQFFLFFLATLPLLFTIVSAVYWLSSLLTKMDGNIQIVVNRLNDPIIPILKKISKQKIGRIKTISADSIQFSTRDTLLVVSVQNAVKQKQFEEQIRAITPSIYSYLADANKRKGNTEQTTAAVDSYFDFYAKNKDVTPSTEIYKTMEHLKRELKQVASKH